MTNETLINFENTNNYNDALEKLSSIIIDKEQFLTIITEKNNLSIFIKIDFHKLIKNDKVTVNGKIVNLNKYLYPIKRTGSHSDKGVVITNLKQKKIKIKNHHIYRIVSEYFGI